MKPYIFFAFALFLSNYALAQGTFWYENFDGATNKWDAASFTTAFPLGSSNGTLANKWIINNLDPLTSPCGSGNKSLHVTCNSGFLCTLFGAGANYDDGPDPQVATDRITSSQSITTPAAGTITLKFNWYSEGSATDFGRAYYSINNGATWTQVGATVFNSQTTQTSFSATLPATCNGISTFKIGFRWTSDGNGDGADPAFNIDDIELLTPGPAITINSVTTNPFCPGDAISINFTGTHTYYGACNTFTATMNPGSVVIGTLNLNSLTQPTTGTINGTIPGATLPGAYTITVSSSNTSASSTPFNITVNNCSAPNITTNAISPLSYCPNAAVTVPFTANGTYNAGNIFTAQLSNSVGSFAAPTSIGTLALSGTNLTNSIAATIPGATPAGAGYRIRVVSSNPVVTGTDNGANITINSVPSTSAISPTAAVCVGAVVNYSVTNTAGSSYNWVVSGGTINSGQGTNTINVTWNTAGAQTVTVTETNAGLCAGTPVSVNITVNPAPNTSAISPTSAVCIGDIVNYSVTNTAGSTYSWVVSGGTINSGQGSNTINVTWNTAGSQTITVTETNASLCGGTPISVNITVTSCTVPTINTGSISPLTYCAGDAMTVPFTSVGTYTAGNIFTAQLSDGVGSFATPTNIGTLALSGVNPSGNIASVVPLASLAGAAYRVRVVSSAPVVTGSDNGANISINVKDAFAVSVLAKDTVVCIGSIGTYTVKNNQDTYNWVVSGGGSIASGQGTTTLTVNWTTVGTFTVTMNGTVGACSNTPKVINVTVSSPTAMVSITPTGVCAGQAILLTANPTNGGTSPTYQWFINAVPVSGATNSTFTTPITLVAGDIVQVVMTSNGTCVSPLSATAQVTVGSGSVAGIASSNQTLCAGNAAVLTLAGSSGSIQWQSSTDNVTFTNILGATSSTLTTSILTQTTFYRASVTTGSCTPNTSNVVTITINPQPNVAFTANPNPASLPNATVTFNNTTTGALSYDWTFGDGGTSIETSPSYTYLAQGNYTVTLIATSLLGCKDTLTATVMVLPEGSTIYIPNIFTPNNDGQNDTFGPIYSNYTNIKIQIFNRWGMKLYQGSDAWKPADSVPDGVYTYVISAVNISGKTDTKVGTITLLR